jgi:hypothetical protein
MNSMSMVTEMAPTGEMRYHEVWRNLRRKYADFERWIEMHASSSVIRVNLNGLS